MYDLVTSTDIDPLSVLKRHDVVEYANSFEYISISESKLNDYIKLSQHYKEDYLKKNCHLILTYYIYYVLKELYVSNEQILLFKKLISYTSHKEWNKVIKKIITHTYQYQNLKARALYMCCEIMTHNLSREEAWFQLNLNKDECAKFTATHYLLLAYKVYNGFNLNSYEIVYNPKFSLLSNLVRKEYEHIIPVPHWILDIHSAIKNNKINMYLKEIHKLAG